jgi:hypothetical protein
VPGPLLWACPGIRTTTIGGPLAEVGVGAVSHARVSSGVALDAEAADRGGAGSSRFSRARESSSCHVFISRAIVGSTR